MLLQARLQEATRQLSGGGFDGLSFREVRQRLAESEGKLMKAVRAEEEQAAKVSNMLQRHIVRLYTWVWCSAT
jgi:hypothetical protein